MGERGRKAEGKPGAEVGEHVVERVDVVQSKAAVGAVEDEGEAEDKGLG